MPRTRRVIWTRHTRNKSAVRPRRWSSLSVARCMFGASVADNLRPNSLLGRLACCHLLNYRDSDSITFVRTKISKLL
ncbi:hypothetical protein BJX63DRAFT_381556 [Aspergillus granulosus]|uniref:Uncharacterized protein n=1 Tax=Aspergillus granulosus TaxID=176169 RepID=A0ABR4HXC4_9EURO